MFNLFKRVRKLEEERLALYQKIQYLQRQHENLEKRLYRYERLKVSLRGFGERGEDK